MAMKYDHHPGWNEGTSSQKVWPLADLSDLSFSLVSGDCKQAAHKACRNQ